MELGASNMGLGRWVAYASLQSKVLPAGCHVANN